MSEPLLQLEHCTMQFGGLKAVADLDLTVGKGDLIGLIGPNGAGKTTVFNVITGVYAPTQGTVRFQGRTISGRKANRIACGGIRARSRTSGCSRGSPASTTWPSRRTSTAKDRPLAGGAADERVRARRGVAQGAGARDARCPRARRVGRRARDRAAVLGCTGGRHRSVVIAEQLARAAPAPRLPHRGPPPGRRPCRLIARPNVVALGGGHGLAVTLRAIRAVRGDDHRGRERRRRRRSARAGCAATSTSPRPAISASASSRSPSDDGPWPAAFEHRFASASSPATRSAT